MIVLVGESASGKSTVESILCKNYGYKKIVSYTTRQPREGEQDGVDYHFIDRSQFRRLKLQDFFAETAEYNGWFYGTAKKDCTDDKVAVLTPHGMRQMKKINGINVTSFYIKVPRRDRLIKILERKDNIEEAYRRNVSDVGQFDGIEDEVSHVIENPGYETRPEFIAKTVDFLYNQRKVNKNKLTILCDIDEVVNDLVQKLVDKYNATFGENLLYESITEYEITKFIKPEHRDAFWELCDKELITGLEMQPKAKEIIERLIRDHNFYFVTSTFAKNISTKHEWLASRIEGYSEENLVMCRNKSLISGDIIIDDCLDNIINSTTEHRIIMDRPWNRKPSVGTRAYGWNDIDIYIKKLEEKLS